MIGPVRIIGTQEYVAESYQLGVGVFIKNGQCKLNYGMSY